MTDPFDYIKRYYGVSPEIGMHVEVDGRAGVIKKDLGNYIGVAFDDDKSGTVRPCHPTWRVMYQRRKYYWWRGWVGAEWEPVSIHKNKEGDEIVFFLGRKEFSFKTVVGGEFAEEIPRYGKEHSMEKHAVAPE